MRCALLPLYMGLAVTFLSGTFLSSIQKRVKGGDSDLEPIDSWLITQGMVRGHQLIRALVPAALNPCYLLSPCESDRTRPFSPSDPVPNFLLSLHNLLKPQASSPRKHLLWFSAEVCALGAFTVRPSTGAVAFTCQRRDSKLLTSWGSPCSL